MLEKTSKGGVQETGTAAEGRLSHHLDLLNSDFRGEISKLREEVLDAIDTSGKEQTWRMAAFAGFVLVVMIWVINAF